MYARACRGVRAYVCVCVGGVIGEISDRQRTSPQDPAPLKIGERLDMARREGWGLLVAWT